MCNLSRHWRPLYTNCICSEGHRPEHHFVIDPQLHCSTEGQIIKHRKSWGLKLVINNWDQSIKSIVLDIFLHSAALQTWLIPPKILTKQNKTFGHWSDSKLPEQSQMGRPTGRDWCRAERQRGAGTSLLTFGLPRRAKKQVKCLY